MMKANPLNHPFKTKRSWNQLLIFNREYENEAMLDFFKNPDRGLQATLLKHDTSVKIDSTIVGLIHIENQPIVVKRYNIKGVLHGLKKCLWRTRAKKCWNNAHRLLQCGLNTPKPIAMIEKRFGPFRRESYYIYKYTPGKTVKEILERKNENYFSIIDLLLDTLLCFQKNKIYHGDMKLLNFLITDNNELSVIDLDSMAFYSSKLWFHFLRQKDAKHLIAVNFQNNKKLSESLFTRLKQRSLLKDH